MEIKVTSSELRAKADELEQYNSKFKSEVEKMTGYEQDLRSMWEGDAQKAFSQAFMTDKGKMDAFSNNIALYIAALRADSVKYDQAEAQATSIGQTRNS